ncbi:unnamed protein product [Rhodiola kirilowii]
MTGFFCHGGLLPHHVAYGIERMNNEVSQWMRGLTESESSPSFPFIATRGYDSVVWSRLYSRDTSELEDLQIQQARPFCLFPSLLYNIFLVVPCCVGMVCMHY